MLHLVEIMIDETEVAYSAAHYVVDIEPPVDEAARQQLQYRLDALLADAPFDGAEELFSVISPIEQIDSDEDQDTLANNIAGAALNALEAEGIIFKQQGA